MENKDDFEEYMRTELAKISGIMIESTDLNTNEAFKLMMNVYARLVVDCVVVASITSGVSINKITSEVCKTIKHNIKIINKSDIAEAIAKEFST